jgi:glycosyltransferase involved in cell wall biosynthesis
MTRRANMPDLRLKVALLINVVAPARIPVYSGLAANFDLLVLHGGIESNRDSWHDIDKLLGNATVTEAWGWQIQISKKVAGKFFDPKYLHLTPGCIWHLLRFRPDAVVVNEMGFRTLVALSYGTLFGRPVWVWWGGTLHTERDVGFLRRTMRRAISRWARNWISYGHSSTEYLRSLGIDANQILELQNAADEQRFATEAEPEFRLPSRPVVLHVGQFIARKGIESLLRTASVLQKEGREFSLLLVGSGRDRLDLEQLAKDLDLRNVHFVAAQPPEKMPAVYRSGDVLIFPTLEDVWGLVANEAILSGIPVLCSKYAGCAQELFEPESTFDPQNPAEFIAKLRKAVDGQLPQPDPSRLKTTAQIVGDLVQALKSSIDEGSKRRIDVMIGELRR